MAAASQAVRAAVYLVRRVSLVLGLAGCAVPNVQLPPTPGSAVVTYRSAIVFAREQPQLSVAARDYVYLGPVQLNRKGRRRHFLWVGVASTIDRDFLGQASESVATAFVQADAKVVELTLEPWPGEALPYDVAAPVRESLFAEIGTAELRAIAAARSVEVTLVGAPVDETADVVPSRYRHFRGRWPTVDVVMPPEDVGFSVEMR